MHKSKSGFTIVELLIVIVIIAILAALALAAFNGVRTRAADSAVQSDLRNFAIKIQDHYISTGSYPTGGATTAFPAGITYKTSKQSYDITSISYNFYYCTVAQGPDARFALAAKSTSGTVWAYYNGGFQPYSGAYASSTTICPNVGILSSETYYDYHYGYGAAGWHSWTN